jgi:zinc D-Ala-D-Ala carboxypeptidase
LANNLKFLTEHFTWAEAVVTNHRSIDNTIDNAQVLDNIPKTATKLEKVRALLGVPILVSSWYRCPELNAAVGGAKNSDHLIGAAVDFIAPQLGTPFEVAKKIANSADIIRFKQLIMEHTWVHISWDMIPNVNPKLEVLSLLSGGGYARGFTDKDGTPLV